MKRNILCIMAAIFAIVIFSCDADGIGGKPWAGQEIKKMSPGSYGGGGSGIYDSDADKTYWYYVDAKKDMTYEIAFNIHFTWLEMLSKYALAYMTCYKEDGTIIVADKKPGIGQPIYYYSPINQRLYISFRFSTAGSIMFYYREHEDYNEFKE